MNLRGKSADVMAMDTSLYVLRNDATATASRHPDLDQRLGQPIAAALAGQRPGFNQRSNALFEEEGIALATFH